MKFRACNLVAEHAMAYLAREVIRKCSEILSLGISNGGGYSACILDFFSNGPTSLCCCRTLKASNFVHQLSVLVALAV